MKERKKRDEMKERKKWDKMKEKQMRWDERETLI